MNGLSTNLSTDYVGNLSFRFDSSKLDERVQVLGQSGGLAPSVLPMPAAGRAMFPARPLALASSASTFCRKRGVTGE